MEVGILINRIKFIRDFNTYRIKHPPALSGIKIDIKRHGWD